MAVVTRALALASVLALTLSGAPARAAHGSGELGRTNVVYDAPTPCTVACDPYGLSPVDPEPSAACAAHPTVPQGSYADILVTVPAQIEGRAPSSFTAQIWPEIDYDLYLCRIHGAGTPEERRELLARGATYLVPGECKVDAVMLGCQEFALASVQPGDVLLLRAYNYADRSPAPGYYGFDAVGDPGA